MANHEFVLRPETDPCDYGDLMRQSRDDLGDCVLLDMDIYWYIGDGLNWIPSVIPHNMKAYPNKIGLDEHGMTVINKVGAPIAYKIFKSWAEIFSCGPDLITLTNTSKELLEDDFERYQKYKVASVEKCVLVRTFETLAQYADQASTGKFYIWHLGI